MCSYVGRISNSIIIWWRKISGLQSSPGFPRHRNSGWDYKLVAVFIFCYTITVSYSLLLYSKQYSLKLSFIQFDLELYYKFTGFLVSRLGSLCETSDYYMLSEFSHFRPDVWWKYISINNQFPIKTSSKCLVLTPNSIEFDIASKALSNLMVLLRHLDAFC